ncbi:MAG: peptide ABC transporter substrate-binding protein [Simkania negevensis]|nr:peptide ABC transporter substrate-binding protein [Simkania negevensis]
MSFLATPLQTAQTSDDSDLNKILWGAAPVHFAHYSLLKKITKKYPQSFDSDARLELDRLMAMPAIEFKKQRSLQHILRIAYSHYFIQRDLVKASKMLREKRHLKLRTIRAQLEYPFGKKAVLGLIIGICLKEKYELLEENHIFQAALKYLPSIRAVKRSFYSHHDSYENTRLIYMELEKSDGSSFTTKEIGALRHTLLQELERRVEKLAPRLFVTHNEEEVIKNILMLGRELTSVNDIPQVMIFFEEQLPSELVFSVIITRILKKGVSRWSDSLLTDLGGGVRCLQTRSHIIGYLRKTYPKEAIMLRLHIPKDEALLRMDSSINLYLAREKVATLTEQIMGEFRDYNGGLMLKRQELLSQLKQSFKKEAEEYPDLLENIFYSIIPVETQAVSALRPLEVLTGLFFQGIKHSLSREGDYFLKVEEEDNQVFVFVRAEDSSLTGDLNHCLEHTLSITQASLISAIATFQGTSNLGYIYQESCLEKRREFLQAIGKAVQQWQQRVQGTQILKLSVLNLPISLDPRLGGDEKSGNVLRMLYEGLMRIGADGMPGYGVAESFTLSKNLKQYIFYLRNSYWSNGMKVTAYDFEYTWKKILSPPFETAFTYLFYPIKNAKIAKEGCVSSDEIGVKAIDERTLQVDLEAPTPYFLELTAHALYSPVNHFIDINHPDWSCLEGDSYVCNGPFRLEKMSAGHSYELLKNENYWDKSHVRLDKIFVFKSTPYTALERYRKSEIDWLGRPLSPWESFFCSKQSSYQSYLSGAVYWGICNTVRFPFNHLKIRQALAFAIHRREIVDMLSYDGLPSTTPLPLIHTLNLHKGVADGDKEKAQSLFQEALQELGLQREQFPSFTLIYTNRAVKNKVAQLIQEQWRSILGINCKIEGYEWSALFAKMLQGDYDIGCVGWIATVDHPLYILDLFKNKENPINFSKWENVEYTALLDEAVQQQGGEGIYRSHLAKAEQILIEQLPVIPIFYEIERYEKLSSLRGVSFSKSGNIDFKTAYISKEELVAD